MNPPTLFLVLWCFLSPFSAAFNNTTAVETTRETMKKVFTTPSSESVSTYEGRTNTFQMSAITTPEISPDPSISDTGTGSSPNIAVLVVAAILLTVVGGAVLITLARKIPLTMLSTNLSRTNEIDGSREDATTAPELEEFVARDMTTQLSVVMSDARDSDRTATATGATTTGSNKDSTQNHGATTVLSNAGMTTVASVDQGIALPGYLEVQSSDYRSNRKIAKGGTSEIFLGLGVSNSLQGTGALVIKFVHEKMSIEMFKQEVAIMAIFVGCKNIVQLVGFDLESRVIIMKLCRYGNLDSWCYNQGSVFKALRSHMTHTSFLVDIGRGLKEIHRRLLVHCDLKTSNILVDVDNSQELFCVITDLGASQVRRNFDNKVRGFQNVEINAISSRFAAPEIIQMFHRKRNLVHEPEIDIYSFGMVMYHLLTRKRPFSFAT